MWCRPGDIVNKLAPFDQGMKSDSRSIAFRTLSKPAAVDAAASILVIDEHEIVRAGIRQLVAGSSPRLSVDGEASTAGQALELLLLGEWDVIVLDTVLPDQNGLDFIRTIRGLYPSIPVLVFTMNRGNGARAVRAGATGFVTKDAPGVELVAAMRALLAGREWVSESVARAILLEDASSDDLHDRLSPREREVMDMILSGLRPKEIACRLNVSIKTVSTHRTRLMKKIGVDDSLSLIRYAIRHRLFSEGQELAE